MAKEFAKAFYGSQVWRKFRNSYVKECQLKDGGLCEVCRTRAGQELHHIKELTPENIGDAAVTLNKENVKFMCRKCHFGTKDDNYGKYRQRGEVQDGAYFTEGGKLAEQKIYIICGAPHCGKAEYVRKHKAYGDFVLDMTDLFAAFGGDRYDLPQALFGNVCDVFDFILSQIKERKLNTKTIWIIGTYPKKRQRENLVKQLNAELVFIDKSYEDCVTSVHTNKKIKNKDFHFRLIRKWFDDYEK